MEKNHKENETFNEVEDFLNLGVVINDKGEVLIVRRTKEEIGKDGSVLIWSLPGGRQRLNETREECVKRKILARTGYDVESIKQISLRPHPQFPVFIVYHLCRLASPRKIQKPSEPHEVAEIRWVKPEGIKEFITTDLDPKVSKELGL